MRQVHYLDGFLIVGKCWREGHANTMVVFDEGRDGSDREVEQPWVMTEVVVDPGTGSVQADGNAMKSDRLKLLRHPVVHQGPIRANVRGKTPRHRVLDQAGKVSPQEGLASGKGQNTNPGVRQLVDNVKRLAGARLGSLQIRR